MNLKIPLSKRRMEAAGIEPALCPFPILCICRESAPRRVPRRGTTPARASHVEGDVDPNARRPSSEGLRGQGGYPGSQAGARLENG